MTMNLTTLPFFTLLAVITTWSSCESNDNPSNESVNAIRDGGRIINGLPAAIKTFPYVVEIQHYNSKGDFWYFRCVGSIMTVNVILTACHCIRDEPFTNDHIKFRDLKDVRILAGVSNRYEESKAQTVTVKEFLPHPMCTSPPKEGYYTDVALLILGSDLHLNEFVGSVKILSKDPKVVVEEQNKLVKAGARCSSLGWGFVEPPPSAKSLDELQVTNLTLIDGKLCSQLWCDHNKFYCNEDMDQDNYICAISDNSTMCRGDSGGPLICIGYLFGVDNLGDQSCRFKVPTIFGGMKSIMYFVNFF